MPSSVDATRSCLAVLERLNPALQAFITPMADQALADAEVADRAAEAGNWLGVLHGVPVAVKDCIDVAGVRCTSGSRAYADNVAKKDAVVTRRLRAAGAVIIGKTNLHELSFGGTTQNEHFGSCRNAWNPERLPGGSSGGSAVAAATGMCSVAIGSDTGGSIRAPSALNGLVGLRATMGSISGTGIMPVCPPHDIAGPMARRVTDVARTFTALAGHDPSDPYSVDRPAPDVLSGLRDPLDGVRIAILGGFFKEGVAPEIATAVDAAARVLESRGAVLCDAEIPEAAGAPDALQRTIFADAVDRHRALLLETPDLLSEAVRTRMAPGRAMAAMDYAAAQRWLEHWRWRMRRFFDETAPVVLSATVGIPTPPIAAAADVIALTGEVTRLCWGWAAARIPAITIPCGFTRDGMPIGLQLAAAPWQEPLLLRLAWHYQDATAWHLQEPPLAKGG